MLNLAEPTRSSWVDEATASLDEILLDHAHCEKKAASAALNLIFRYQHFEVLLRPLSEVVREEMEHFEQVLELLHERAIPFQRQRPSPYGRRLHEAVREHEPERMLDLLLCASLIEARSCERMKLLAGALTDASLADYYRGLLATEARHHHLYVELALALYDKPQVMARLAELAVAEADALREPAYPVRMHS